MTPTKEKTPHPEWINRVINLGITFLGMMLAIGVAYGALQNNVITTVKNQAEIKKDLRDYKEKQATKEAIQNKILYETVTILRSISKEIDENTTDIKVIEKDLKELSKN